MASPFRIFRKHEKVMLAVLGIAAMFAFVVLGPLSGFLSRSGGRSQNPVVASWDGRTVHRSELEAIVHIRKICGSFLNVAAQEGMVVTGQRPPVPILVQSTEDRSAQRVLALRTMMLADMAARAGIDVSDETVNQYLRYLTQNSVNPKRLTALFHRLFGQSGVTESMMFDLLRQELLGVEYLRSYQLSAATTLPNTRWELWKKLNDTISLQLVTLPVKDFVAKVPEPTEDELKEFFEKYRSDVKTPKRVANTELPSPRPGFKVPRMVVLEYLKADFDDFVERMAKEISGDEVAQYYEDHKDEFKRVELKAESDLPDEPPAEENSLSPSDTSTSEPVDEPKQPPVESSENKPQNQTETDEKGTQNKQPDEAAVGESSNRSPDEGASDDSSSPSPEGEEPEESNAPPPGDRSSARTSRTAHLSLVAYQDESQEVADSPRSNDAGQANEGTENDTPPDSDSPPPAPEPDATGTSPPTTPSTDNAKAAEDTAPSTTAEDTPASGGESSVDAGEPAAPTASTDAESSASADQYQPLSEVSDEIRRRLAEQRAAARIEQDLADPLRIMRLYGEDRSAAEAAAKSKKESDKKPLPEPPGLETLAKDSPLIYEKTAPLSYFDLRDTDVGKSGNSEYPYTLAVKIYSPNEQGVLRMYQPQVTMDGMTGDRYLVWKIKDEAAHEVPLDEIRDQVVAAWKMEKARALAREEAERLAEKAKQKGGSLEQIFGGDDKYRATSTDAFSWLTTGAATPEGSVSLRLSDVTGVESAGPEFMESVFALKPDEVSVVTNYPQTDVYLVQLAEREMTPSELHEKFMGSVDPGDITSRSLYGRLLQQSMENAQSLVFREVQETLNVEINLPSSTEGQ